MTKLRGPPERLYAGEDRPLTMRVSRSERELIGQAAARSGVTVSAWVRRAARRVLELEAAAKARTEAAE